MYLYNNITVLISHFREIHVLTGSGFGRWAWDIDKAISDKAALLAEC
jgi:hypothetical protein